MGSMVSYRVPRSGIQQFARLNFNSNPPPPKRSHDGESIDRSLYTDQEWFSIVREQVEQALPTVPSAVCSLIVGYLLSSELVTAEAHGQITGWEETQLTQKWSVTTQATHYISALTIRQTHQAHTNTLITAARDGHMHFYQQLTDESTQQPGWKQVAVVLVDREVTAMLIRHTVDAVTTGTSALLVVATDSPMLSLYEVDTKRQIPQYYQTTRLTHSGKISGLSPFTASRAHLVSCSWDGDCRVWELGAARSLVCLCVLSAGMPYKKKSLTCVSAVSDRLVIAGDVEGNIKGWILPTDATTQRREGGALPSLTLSFSFAASSPSSAVRAVIGLDYDDAHHDDREYFSSGCDDGVVRIWLFHAPSVSCVCLAELLDSSVLLGEAAVMSLLHLPSGRLAAGMSRGWVCIWEEIQGVLSADYGGTQSESSPLVVDVSRKLTRLTKSVRALACHSWMDIC